MVSFTASSVNGGGSHQSLNERRRSACRSLQLERRVQDGLQYVNQALDSRYWYAKIHGRAELAQLVEHQLPKLGVAGSSPVFRSIFIGGVAKW